MMVYTSVLFLSPSTLCFSIISTARSCMVNRVHIILPSIIPVPSLYFLREEDCLRILGIHVLPLVLSPKITATSFIVSMKFERGNKTKKKRKKKGKKALKAHDLKRKHPEAEEMRMLVRSSQASVHCAIIAKAAKRALRILIEHSNYRDVVHMHSLLVVSITLRL